METAQSAQAANMGLVMRVGPVIAGEDDGGEDLFADDFVFHFVNPHLPDLAGDHHGAEGFRRFFERLREETGFRNQPHSLTPYGDELVVAYVTNTVEIGDTPLDLDAVVVWRVFGGRIHEAWDIPAVNTMRPHPT